MTRRLRSESGWALVTAMLVMAGILTAGMASYAFVDGQVAQSGKERGRESTYNYTEGLLNAETFLLAANWSQTAPLPDCTYSGGTVTASNGQTAMCPSASTLGQAFSGPAYSSGVTWTVKVRDDGGTDACQSGVTASTCSYYYSDSGAGATLSQPAYDANKDGQLWVRAQAVVNGVRRTLVARVTRQQVALDFPHAVVTAGHYTMNNGRWATTFANGADLGVRCPSAQQQPPNPAGCVTTKDPSQIQPASAIKPIDSSPALSSAELQQLRARAVADGAWYQTCPVNPPGPLVFVESGSCGASALPQNTTQTSPATYVQVSGTLTISGASSSLRDFWGVIYLANQSGLTGDVFSATGNHNFHGSINVDGQGGVNVGTSSNTSLSYDGNAFGGLWAYGNTTIVRPSFREIVSSTP